MTNQDAVSSFGLKIAGNNRLYVLGVEQALEQAGYTEADMVEIYEVGRDTASARWSAGRVCTLRMPDGVKLPEADPMPSAVLLDGAGITVTLERMLVADDGIGIGLRLKNDTDQTVCLELQNPIINGEACEKTFNKNQFNNSYNPVMPPHTQAVRCVSLELTEDMIAKGPVRELAVTLSFEGVVSGETTIHLTDTAFGADGGTVLTSNEVSVVPAVPVLYEEKPSAIKETIETADEKVYQITVAAPVSETQADQVNYINANLCLLDWQQVEDDGSLMPITRVLAGTTLERNEQAWGAVFSGFTAMVQDHFIRANETRLTDGQWKLKPDAVYFYCEEGSLNPTGEMLLFNGGVSMYSEASVTVRIDEDHTAVVTDSSVTLSGWLRSMNGQRNASLDEIVEAAVENRVFFGTDRATNFSTLDYSDVHRLDTSEPIVISLVSAESIPGEKCLYFAIFYLDGSREDVLLSLDGKTVLDRTVTAGKTE